MSADVKTLRVEIAVRRGAYAILPGIAGLLCAVIALVSYRYLLGDGAVPPLIASNVFRNPWLLVHVAGAATALLVGPAHSRRQ